MTSLLDQSALQMLADRLVDAARKAGADAADAVAVRSMSLSVDVRDGAVEESQRSESDDVGLRVFLGRRQAVVSSNDLKTDAAQLAEPPVAMAEGPAASAGIGGMVLVASNGFSGAYLFSRHGLSASAIAGEGTGMERDYDYSSALHASDLDAPERIGRSAGGRAGTRLHPRKVPTRKEDRK